MYDLSKLFILLLKPLIMIIRFIYIGLDGEDRSLQKLNFRKFLLLFQSSPIFSRPRVFIDQLLEELTQQRDLY
jgi:hypothetical protein